MVAVRTIADSVTPAGGPPANLTGLERELEALRRAHPGAIFRRYLDSVPRVGASVFIAEGASIIGDVILGEGVSVWYSSVLRGDVNRIEVRRRSNLQDGVVVHLGDRDPVLIDEDVVVGHRAVIHGCTIGAGCLVGIQSTILDGASIGEGSVIGSGALVTAGTVIPSRSLVLGVPGKVVKKLTAEDEVFHRKLAGKYVRLAHNYLVG